MIGTDLLAVPVWESLNDGQLAIAIHVSKVRAVQTFSLMAAHADECGAKPPLATTELYAQHCILTVKDGSKLLEEWDELRLIDWCNDPRVYHFCTLYDRKYRERENLPYPTQCPTLLRRRVNYAYAQVNQVSTRAIHAMFAAALASAESRSECEFALVETQRLLNAAIKMATLVTMNLNAYMDSFVSR